MDTGKNLTLLNIYDKTKQLIAIVIRKELSLEKTTFFSADNYSQQIGIIKYPKEGRIKPHYHNKISREVFFTQEVLVIRKGKVKVDLYDSELNFIESVILNDRDVIFLISGGHGFEMLEDTEMLEIKQGPYSGVSNDKTHFERKNN